MKPERVPGDGAQAAKTYLETVLPPLFPSRPPTVGLNVPRAWTPDSAPHVGVFDDGAPTKSWPIAMKTQIRVTAWSNGRTISNDIAGRCMGMLMANLVPGITVTGMPFADLEGVDPHNGGHTKTFTVAAQVRTIAV